MNRFHIRALTSFAISLPMFACSDRNFRDVPPEQSSEMGGTSGQGGEASSGGAAGGGQTPEQPEPGVPSIVLVEVGGKWALRVEPEPAIEFPQGVRSDARIEVTFSEAMDKVATQAAYNSPSAVIKPSSVTFSWNSEGTVLTVIPDQPLPYSQRTSVAEAADELRFNFSTAARSSKGVDLRNEVALSFSALRRITQTIKPSTKYTGGVRKNNCSSGTPAHPSGPAPAYALHSTSWGLGVRGDCSTQDGSRGPHRGFGHFDLSTVAAKHEPIESAQLELELGDEFGAGWAAIGGVRVSLVDFGLVEIPAAGESALNSVYNASTRALSPDLSEATPSANFDVLSDVEEAIERGYVQYRIAATSESGTDLTQVVATRRNLVLVYLAP